MNEQQKLRNIFLVLCLTVVTLLTNTIDAVDANRFKTCNKSAHCRRYRKFTEWIRRGSSREHEDIYTEKTEEYRDHYLFVVDSIDTIVQGGHTLEFQLRNTADNSAYTGRFTGFTFGAVRFTICGADGKYSSEQVGHLCRGGDTITKGEAGNSDGVWVDPYIFDASGLGKLCNNGVIVEYDVHKRITYLKYKFFKASNLVQRRDESEVLQTIIVEIHHQPFVAVLVIDGQKRQILNHRQFLNLENLRSEEKLEKRDTNVDENDCGGDSCYVDINEEDELLYEDEDEDEFMHKVKRHNCACNGTANFDNKKIVVDAVSLDDTDIWEERLNKKPKGPEAVGIDVTFEASHVYGLPSHATNLDLPVYDEPYRLYNLDVFEYILDSPMALYGAVPLLWAVHPNVNSSTPVDTIKDVSFSGFLWTNPSDTFVKLDRGGLSGAETNTWWSSEAGILDAFFFTGPTPQDILTQYYTLTGLPFMPPIASIGKHQSRWNYKNEAAVMSVNEGYDKHNIPLDVIWLDIEHTDNKKYFSWNYSLFPDPLRLINNLRLYSRRRLTAIVDPHIKKTSEYRVYDEMAKHGLLLLENNVTYNGWCWSGDSVYPDYLHPATKDYWGKQFSDVNWPGTDDSVFVWNDMNEPSVFNGPEGTIPKHAVHMDGMEHRMNHNLYGMMYHTATYKGLAKRNTTKRPFVLTRAFFIGTHRTAAVWTGDNDSSWSHLTASIPMCLSHALSGIQFIGADVGGFFGDPPEDLLIRWHQLGIWYPFYRAHSHIDTKRREPWLASANGLDAIRNAVRTRYRLLPFWYTLFAENSLFGESIIQPLWWVDPTNFDFYTTDDAMMIGKIIYVRALSEQEALGSHVILNLPKCDTRCLWYDFYNPQNIFSSGHSVVPVNPNYIPTYIMGGKIFFTKERVRRSSAVFKEDPFTVNIFLGVNGNANGNIYVDDYETYLYRERHEFAYEEWSFNNFTTLSSKALQVALDLNDPNRFTTGNIGKTQDTLSVEIERIALHGLRNYPESVSVDVGNGYEKRDFIASQAGELFSVLVKKPQLKIGDAIARPWKLTISYS